MLEAKEEGRPKPNTKEPVFSRYDNGVPQPDWPVATDERSRRIAISCFSRVAKCSPDCE